MTSIRDYLLKLDIMKVIPEDAKQSTIIGVVFSSFFTILASVLFINELSTLLSVKTSSELLIDHLKDDVDIPVWIDIEMPYYPCGMVSLDKMDVIHSHIVDVQEDLTKYRLDQRGKSIGKFLWSKTQTVAEMDFNEKINTVQAQIDNSEGCRIFGTFSVKAVPGNFHISFHNYGDMFQYMMQRGKWQPDMSHKIKSLRFGSNSSKTTSE